MSATPVMLAAPGLPEETDIVALLTRPGSTLTISRRCVDALDLLAAASEGSARVALVSASLPRLTRDTLARLTASRVRVIGLARADSSADRETLSDLGLTVVEVQAQDLSMTLAAVESIAVDDAAPNLEYSGGEVGPARSLDAEAPGRLIAVWGPIGAPGRTTVSVALADEWARSGTPALLVDADTVGGGAVAAHLGILDDVSGIVVACRQADTGRLAVADLAAAARTVDRHLRVLTGLPRADRWAELRPPALVRLWETCRSTPGVSVVDVGFSLERDEELLIDVRTPRRAAATLTALDAADGVIAVGTADPVGIERFIAGLADLRQLLPHTPIRAVVTRVRRSALGADPQGQIREALYRHAGLNDVTLVPDDPAAFDSCLREGRTLGEVAARSAARGVFREFVSRWEWAEPRSRVA